MNLPSPFPLVQSPAMKITDGGSIEAPAFCKNTIQKNTQCKEHYAVIAGEPEGFFICPFGFTTRTFTFEGKILSVSGVIAHPRFDLEKERKLAKQFPASRCSRASIDAYIKFLQEIEHLRADAVADAAKVLPQAFHELRKLNGTVLQHAEREISDLGERRGLMSIKGAAELMRNNFDILEALSNIESMRALPSDSTINLFDLAFKMKRILQQKAAAKSMHINVEGLRVIVKGSQKSFPIVPAVLLENAIKYGDAGTSILIESSTFADRAIMIVENSSSMKIDPTRCFERGVRFSTDIEGGGFGLFLAREIITSHQGTIKCEANGGRVRMIVDLPLVSVIA